MKHTTKNITKIFTVLTVSLFLLGGCASQLYHDFIMSGQVVSANGNELVVCVADTNNLEENSLLKVYRAVYDANVITEGESGYSREYIGEVRLGGTRDTHFANATIVSGNVLPNDIVEFDPKQ